MPTNHRFAQEPPSPDAPIVRAEALHKIYGAGDTAVVALDRVNLTIRRSEFVAIMGPSGCGKSTLLHLLGGLDQPTSGHVFVDGVDLGSLGDDQLAVLRRERIGFVFQFFNLIPVLSAVENVALPLVLAKHQRDSEPRAREWLSRVGLADRAGSRPDQLSGGQQQRVALARALVTDPALILADEPTGNLDSRAADEVLRLLRKTADDWGRTVVMVTHDARMAAYADRIVFMKDGSIVDDTTLGSDTSIDDVLRKAEAAS
jgi:putative ABC transport system ATP-binding protein